MQNSKIPVRSSIYSGASTIIQKIVKVNGEICLKEYQRGKLLGKGGFALCYIAKNLENNSLMAFKIISKDILKNPRTRYKVSNIVTQLENEIKLHKTLHHKHIVDLVGNFEDDQNVYILLELCPNEVSDSLTKSLNELIMKRKKFKTSQVQRFVKEIVFGVKYLHSRNIIHRDLKLGNIFLGENLQIKLGDFGLATKIEFTSDRKRSICGTPNYIAPQIIDGQSYSYPVDIWSIGVILYTLFVGVPPFETDNVQDTYDLIKKVEYKYPESIMIPECAKTLIKQILNEDPSKRPTLDQILQSPFMQLGTKSTVLKEINSLALNKSLSYSPNHNESAVFQMYKQSMSRIQVQEFVETGDGCAYGMSNGLIGIHQKDKILLYSRHFDEIYLVTKSEKSKDMVIKQTGQDSITLKKEVSRYRYLAKQKSSSEASLIYIRKFIKHKDFYTFRLSNQVVQLMFSDNCQILINKYLMVTFMAPGKQPVFGSYDDITQLNNPLFKKKTRYVKEMLDVLSIKRSK